MVEHAKRARNEDDTPGVGTEGVSTMLRPVATEKDRARGSAQPLSSGGSEAGRGGGSCSRRGCLAQAPHTAALEMVVTSQGRPPLVVVPVWFGVGQGQLVARLDRCDGDDAQRAALLQTSRAGPMPRATPLQ